MAIGSAIALIIAAIVGATATAVSGGVSAANTRRAGEEAKRIADLNFAEQQKTERRAYQQSQDIRAAQNRLNDVQMAIERKDRETAEIARRANAALAALNNRNALQGQISTLSFGGR